MDCEDVRVPVETTHAVFKDHWFWPKVYPDILTVHAVDLGPTQVAGIELGRNSAVAENLAKTSKTHTQPDTV
jgi:hypothetical protein